MKPKELKKKNTVRGITLHWNPKDSEDRKRANEAVLKLLKQGYWYEHNSEIISESSIKLRKGLSNRYLKLHNHVDMTDLLMTVVDSEDLASILDYLSHIGTCPMLYTVVKSSRASKPTHRRFRCTIVEGSTFLAASEHVNPLQAVIDAIFLWDKAGRPVLDE